MGRTHFESGLSAPTSPYPQPPRQSSNRRFPGSARIAVLLAAACLGPSGFAAVSNNPGDQLYCQPQEGTTFLIVNGGAGVFTVDVDCYGNNLANNTDTTIATTQGGTMTRVGIYGNYVYTPPTPNFTGLDTFPIHVTTVWNSAGGIGSAGGTTSPGGPLTMTITLNVIPATTTLTVANGAATLVPVPVGSVSGCSVAGNAGTGPVASAVFGCISGIKAGGLSPSHGTLAVSGTTLQYTPASGYSGTDTFTYQARGVNNDGPNSLNSGDVTVTVTVSAAAVPTLGTWSLLLLCGALLLLSAKALAHPAV